MKRIKMFEDFNYPNYEKDSIEELDGEVEYVFNKHKNTHKWIAPILVVGGEEDIVSEKLVSIAKNLNTTLVTLNASVLLVEDIEGITIKQFNTPGIILINNVDNAATSLLNKIFNTIFKSNAATVVIHSNTADFANPAIINKMSIMYL